MSRLRLLGGALRDIRAPAGALFLAAGIALAWTSAQTALEYRGALELRGVVTAKERLRADRKETPATRFVVRYRLELPGGETVAAVADLPRPEWEALAVGGAHPVLYLPEERRALPPAGTANYIGGVIVGLLGLAFAVIGVLLLRKPLRVLALRARLLQRGVQASAVVSEVFQTNTAVNGVILWRLRYRYRDAAGAEHEGESDPLRPAEANGWDAGAAGSALYDPLAPGRSAWLGSAPEPEPARRWPLLRNLALFFIALFAAGVIAELFPALKELDAWMGARRASLLWAAGAATALGVLLLVGAAIALVMESGEPMSHGDIEHQLRAVRDAASLPYARRISSYRLLGIGAGAAGHEQFPLRDLKRALASGAVLADAVWRRRFIALIAAGLIFAGLFGLFIVVSPLALKLVLAAIVLYALARSAAALALA